MKNKISLCICLLLVAIMNVHAQVKVGNNPTTIDANSLLELESTTKGFLPPRVTLTSVSSVSPLTGTVPAGMLVYNSGSTISTGYYYWDGSQWVPVKGESALVTKTANATLTKNETFVVASNDITLTLPAITAADDGLAITIKNIGSYTDQVIVDGNSATIDGALASNLFRWMGNTYVAQGGNWIIKGGDVRTENVFDVSPTGSWTTIDEVIAFLDLHMTGPSVIRLISGDYEITSTVDIDFDYPLTIQSSSYGIANIVVGGGLSGPMFDCSSEAYFKMLAFDGTGYTAAGEDAIHLGTDILGTPNMYYEIKDCTFDGFNKTIVATTNVEMWIFEVDIVGAAAVGLEIAAGGTSDVSLKISETDFIDCEKGINMLSGTDPIVSVLNCGFYCGDGTDIGINYEPDTFTTLNNLFITNNTWNNVGAFMDGFDFTRTDGRDANTFIRNNSGGADQNPQCRINVNNSVTTTTLTTAATWYKANWTNTSSINTKWTVVDNMMTYQPVNRSNAFMIITGNISVDNANRTISVGIVKNGVTTTRYGETDLRVKNANQPEVFATTIYIADIGPNDYFELYLTSANNGDVVIFRDVQWFTENK